MSEIFAFLLLILMFKLNLKIHITLYDFLYNQTKEQNFKKFYLIYTANINLPTSV